MRGKGQWLHKTFRCSRITPAHAGKSRLAGKVLPARRDHPRTRGEKAGCLWLGRVREGSPPHTRGKVDPQAAGKSELGITPARAGKRGTSLSRRKRHGDHPRACGEKGYKLIKAKTPRGSPPRVRGKGVANVHIAPPVRITPARAGKSYLHSIFPSLSRDHPRACGEKSESFAFGV